MVGVFHLISRDPKALCATALFSGVLAACGFAPVGVAFFTILGFIGFFWILREAEAYDRKVSLLVGFFWALSYFSMGLAWCYRSMHVYGGLPAPLAAMGVFALAAVLALFSAVFADLTRFIRCHGTLKVAFVYPAGFTFFEYLRGDVITSFGWLNPGYAFVETPFSVFAPLVGGYGVGFVVVFVAGAVLALLTEKAGSDAKNARAAKRRILTVLFFFGLTAVGTYALEGVEWSKPLSRLEVRLVQPTVPVSVRPTYEGQVAALERVRQMSLATPMGRALDLIVWPESVYTTSLQRLPKDLAGIPVEVSARMAAPVLFNAFSEPVRGEFLNSLLIADVDGVKPVYTKRHLVPFGEYVPLGFRWFVDAMGIPMADQTRGASNVEAVRFENRSAALGICYENMFPAELRDWFEKSSPELILYCVNLAWFSPEATRQFTQMSAMRALETARPVLQCVNNGMSAYILPNGRIERLAYTGAQTLDVTVRSVTGNVTPFVRFGSTPLLGFLVILLAAFFAVGRKKEPYSQSEKAPRN